MTYNVFGGTLNVTHSNSVLDFIVLCGLTFMFWITGYFGDEVTGRITCVCLCACVCACVEIPGKMQLSDWWDCWVGERTTGGRSTHHTGSSHCHWCSWLVSVCLSVCLSLYLSVCLFFCLSLSVCLSICLSVCRYRPCGHATAWVSV